MQTKAFRQTERDKLSTISSRNLHGSIRSSNNCEDHHWEKILSLRTIGPYGLSQVPSALISLFNICYIVESLYITSRYPKFNGSHFDALPLRYRDRRHHMPLCSIFSALPSLHNISIIWYPLPARFLRGEGGGEGGGELLVRSCASRTN